uniref:Uncharacterized protein n=1 Tax=Oryza punctata TaxID=4537 RepID=A0A0E0KET3_ORYPU
MIVIGTISKRVAKSSISSRISPSRPVPFRPLGFGSRRRLPSLLASSPAASADLPPVRGPAVPGRRPTGDPIRPSPGSASVDPIHPARRERVPGTRSVRIRRNGFVILWGWTVL